MEKGFAGAVTRALKWLGAGRLFTRVTPVLEHQYARLAGDHFDITRRARTQSSGPGPIEKGHTLEARKGSAPSATLTALLFVEARGLGSG